MGVPVAAAQETDDMRAIVLSLTVLGAAFAGCISDPEPATDSPSDSPAATSEAAAAITTSSAPETSEPVVNHAPTANLSADVENGSVPLNVTFTIEAFDEDGDELTWTLDADGDGAADYNGTAADTSALHSFAAAGNFTAILNVTDGALFAESRINITVEAPSAPPQLKEDAWVRWDENGVCHAKDARPSTGPIYVQDRPGPGQQWGTGLVTPGGGGTWIYEESNGIPGLQVGGVGESSEYVACLKPDTLIF
jgi:hypothetical protein